MAHLSVFDLSLKLQVWRLRAFLFFDSNAAGSGCQPRCTDVHAGVITTEGKKLSSGGLSASLGLLPGSASKDPTIHTCASRKQLEQGRNPLSEDTDISRVLWLHSVELLCSRLLNLSSPLVKLRALNTVCERAIKIWALPFLNKMYFHINAFNGSLCLQNSV